MRKIYVKYTGECSKCGKELPVGTGAMYEKTTGIFCVGCEPTETEEIRKYRLLKAESRASRYEDWAEKRETRATAQLNSMPEIRHDWAFITQPGHIPLRERMNKSDERAFESLNVARHMRAKADSLRNVRVAGDAERRREKSRQQADAFIKKGSRIRDVIFGDGVVIGVYAKSYRVKWDSGFVHSTDKSHVIPLLPEKEAINNE